MSTCGERRELSRVLGRSRVVFGEVGRVDTNVDVSADMRASSADKSAETLPS